MRSTEFSAAGLDSCGCGATDARKPSVWRTDLANDAACIGKKQGSKILDVRVFSQVMQSNPELCIRFGERVLGFKLDEMESGIVGVFLDASCSSADGDPDIDSLVAFMRSGKPNPEDRLTMELHEAVESLP